MNAFCLAPKSGFLQRFHIKCQRSHTDSSALSFRSVDSTSLQFHFLFTEPQRKKKSQLPSLKQLEVLCIPGSSTAENSSAAPAMSRYSWPLWSDPEDVRWHVWKGSQRFYNAVLKLQMSTQNRMNKLGCKHETKYYTALKVISCR